MMAKAAAFFVYGTLQRHQCRERCWPRTPLKVQLAWVRGRLYDLGPYPALDVGDDPVGGELWWFDPQDLAVLHRTLDEIEVFNQPGQPNLYLRQRAACFVTPYDPETSSQTDPFCVAELYRIADITSLDEAQRILPIGNRPAVWPIDEDASDKRLFRTLT